ncbi:unnamed protein product [Leptosia nina]|uniref:Uncharacterized protein n=1 Tax=Leptosia nina TaxID=320188 RepID=A0AAV1JDC3_9NEOP
MYPNQSKCVFLGSRTQSDVASTNTTSTNTGSIHERVEKTNIFPLDDEELDSVEELLRLLAFLDRPSLRAFLESKNRSITCRIVECFLSNGLGNMTLAHVDCAAGL